MLTKNAYALMFGLMKKEVRINVKSLDGSNDYTNIGSGEYIGSISYDAFGSMGISFSSDKPSVPGLYFGNGNTPPSVNDYKMSGKFVYGLTYNATQVSMDQTDEYTELQATLAVRNTSSVPQTVKEIGLIGFLHGSNGSVKTLLDRIVLATPITIPAGGTKSITYNLRHTY